MMRSQPSFKPGKHAFTFLTVICGKKKLPCSSSTDLVSKDPIGSSLPDVDKASCEGDALEQEEQLRIPLTQQPPPELSDLVTAGQLEVQFLEAPTEDELRQALEVLEPEIVHFQGEQVPATNEIGPLELGDCRISSPELLTSFFTSKLPELVYFETSDARKLGEALHDKGVPYAIFWRTSVTYSVAAHFRRALVAVLQSSAIQVWSAFQLANASFQLHCGRSKARGLVSVYQRISITGPMILGDPPSTLIEPLKHLEAEEEDSSLASSQTVKIYDEQSEFPLLVCADPSAREDFPFKALEDGLNALLIVEVKGMRVLNRVSAPPPPAAASTLARGVVTMRCDLCSSSSARVSLLVSGSAQTCFDDQMLEYCVKKELAQKGRLVSSVVTGDKLPFTAEMRRSAAVACGAPVLEVRVMTSTWAAQVLKQLASEVSFGSLVALGIAGIHGFPVVGFGKEEADCLLSLRPRISQKHDILQKHLNFFCQVPSWLVPPIASRKRRNILSPRRIDNSMHDEDAKISQKLDNDQSDPVNQRASVASSSKSGFSLVAAMKPVYHLNPNRQMPFASAVISGAQSSWSVKINLPNGPPGKVVRPNIVTGSLPPIQGSAPLVSHARQTIRAPSPAQLLPINVLPMKKHGCSRPPIHECSEEEFIKDVIQFLLSKGHSRLVPPGGIDSFPDAILNGKRLDIYSLYKEVVSRGGFHVGNGINWKGQVFSNMRNHTLVNRMTGVGNTLKKHYETYLLEYELAHDDVDGECCILCHSSAPGDWVNCGICGEWAHFGCDQRVGLGAFKDYAKTDGLEYICPRCSATNVRGLAGRRKTKGPAN